MTLGDTSKHWKRKSCEPGYRDPCDRIAHQAVAWLVSLARHEGRQKVLQNLERHRSVICDALILEDGTSMLRLT